MALARAISQLACFAAVASASAWAQAQSTIKTPGARPPYTFEAEPHLLLGPFDPPGSGRGTGLGAGFRGTVELLSEGFLPKLNDSVGIGFGADWVHYPGRQKGRGSCERFVSGPSGTPVCIEVASYDGRQNYLLLPITMQWNFWLHRKWSVFGEPGFAFSWSEGDLDFAPFVIFVGGRYHVTDTITLTLRVGYPTISLGASFLL